jgi:hypothetical protein
MTSQAELESYLTEHLSYEREMLGFAFRQIQREPEQLVWNAYFESFGIHARNLYQFLRSTEGPRSVTADDYLPGWKQPAIPSLEKLNPFFFHMGKQRAIGEKKPALEWALKVGPQLDRTWVRWYDALPDRYRSLVDGKPVCGFASVQNRPSGPLSAPGPVHRITGPSSPR